MTVSSVTSSAEKDTGDGDTRSDKDTGRELAVIGTKTFITGFALAGIRSSIEADASSARQQIGSLLENKNTQARQMPGILIIQEEILSEFSRKEKEKLLEMMRPIVIFISEKQEITLQSTIKRALGIDIVTHRRND